MGRPSHSRSLSLWVNGVHVGFWIMKRSGEQELRYADSWTRDPRGRPLSQPSGMPSFVGLTQHVIEFFDPPEDSRIMTAFQPWLDDPSGPNVPLDQIFNLLHQEYGKDEVNVLVTERLRVPPSGEEVGREHALIKRIPD